MGYERWEISPELARKMRDVARQFRRESTPSEALLWEKLRRKQVGYKFRRQAPIGPFVVDFLCPSQGLIVEVDGSIHESQQRADRERQALIETLGLRFLRVSSEAVEQRLSEVVDTIRAALANLADQNSTPSQ